MIPVVAVHGWYYRKGEALRWDYPLWAKIIGRTVDGFCWNSWPDWWGIFKKGIDPYHRSWNDARAAGKDLFVYCKDKYPAFGFDIMCHSLGSRVTLEACTMLRPRKVLILNGADTVEHAKVTLERNTETQFINVRGGALLNARGDQVLIRLGSKFVPLTREQKKAIQKGSGDFPDLIGWQGLGKDLPANWREEIVWGTHWESFKDPLVWPRLRTMMT